MSLDNMLFEDSELEIISEPMQTDTGKLLKIKMADSTDSFTHSMPVYRYDDKMVEIMAELFYARNKTDIIGEPNCHEQALQTTMEVIRKMMEVVSDEFDPQQVRRVIESKRVDAEDAKSELRRSK